MEQNYYLAVDIGASSGRHMLAWLEDGKIRMEEIYRFENGIRPVNGHLAGIWTDYSGKFWRECDAAGKQGKSRPVWGLIPGRLILSF